MSESVLAALITIVPQISPPLISVSVKEAEVAGLLGTGQAHPLVLSVKLPVTPLVISPLLFFVVTRIFSAPIGVDVFSIIL